jgi:hypothetical protein
MKKYIPLFLVEGYLIFTLIIFTLGPIDFRVHNLLLFFVLMIIYHGFFISGYVLAARYKGSCQLAIHNQKYSNFIYWGLFFFGIISIWASYINIMMLDSLIPHNFFNNLIMGFEEPKLVYTERMLKVRDDQIFGGRFFNILSIFFAFTKMLFIFYCLYFWKNIKYMKKTLLFIYSFLFISTGISAGLNSVIFIFFIFTIISIVVILYDRKYIYLNKLLIFFAVLFIIPITWFGKTMSQRGGGFEYFAATSPLGDISISSGFDLNYLGSSLDFLYYSFVWLSYYICQGYYGFSLILNMDHQWTYGFGSSEFLQRQLLLISGYDVSPMTFQSRADQFWDKSVQWHSFYGQFANDVGFIGLAFFLMAIGFLFAKVWFSAIYGKNFYALALIPIFAIMFIFFPANNQVFGYIDTLSYFVIVSILWILNLLIVNNRNVL